jgi:hypothetical protein
MMSNELEPELAPNQSTDYQIRIKGHLDSRWADWFGGLTISLEQNSETLMTGTGIDQAALFGLLRKIRDLGLPLISINRILAGDADQYDDKLG